MSKETLRPCPFCGCDDLLHENGTVTCLRCSASHIASRWNARSAYGMGAFGKDLEQLVAGKVEETCALPLRRFQLAGASEQEMRSILTQGYSEILASIGADLFAKMPAAIMEQFLIMTITKNHNTRGLLVGLIQSFTTGYAVPQTNDHATKMLEQIEGLAKTARDTNNEILERMHIARSATRMH